MVTGGLYGLDPFIFTRCFTQCPARRGRLSVAGAAAVLPMTMKYHAPIGIDNYNI